MRRLAGLTVLVVVVVVIPVAVYASHQFTDVPNSHTFHNAIGWMKDSRITLGCNPPANTRYCPNDNVTRGQMAAFMKRLADNRVVDAGRLGGLKPQHYLSRYDSVAIDWLSEGTQPITGTLSAGTSLLDEYLLSNLEGGWTKLSYSVNMVKATAYAGAAWLQLDDSSCNLDADRIPGSDSFFDAPGLDSGNGYSTASGTVVLGLLGNHNVTVCAGLTAGSPVTRQNLTLIIDFYPAPGYPGVGE